MLVFVCTTEPDCAQGLLPAVLLGITLAVLRALYEVPGMQSALTCTRQMPYLPHDHSGPGLFFINWGQGSPKPSQEPLGGGSHTWQFSANWTSRQDVVQLSPVVPGKPEPLLVCNCLQGHTQ